MRAAVRHIDADDLAAHDERLAAIRRIDQRGRDQPRLAPRDAGDVRQRRRQLIAIQVTAVRQRHA